MNIDDISDEMWGLYFDVQRSARYHDRRLRFYDSLHKLTAFTSLVFGSSTIAAVMGSLSFGTELAIVSAAIVTIMGSLDLVMGYSVKARQHAELKRQFIDLEMEMNRSPEDEHLAAHTMERLRIEIAEPPIYRALDLLCHNEVVRANGAGEGELQKVNIFQRWTANLLPWAEI